MKTLIFDRNVGFLQHVSELTDDAAALAEFDAEVGISANSDGICIDDWVFYHVSDSMASRVLNWQALGGAADQFPLAQDGNW